MLRERGQQNTSCHDLDGQQRMLSATRARRGTTTSAPAFATRARPSVARGPPRAATTSAVRGVQMGGAQKFGSEGVPCARALRPSTCLQSRAISGFHSVGSLPWDQARLVHSHAQKASFQRY